MYIWLLIAGFVCFAVAIIVQENKINKLNKRFEKMKWCHNGFIDLVSDTFDDLYCQFNERVDEINWEFHNVYGVLADGKEFADDIVDTMELMCDTDEIVLDRINDIEEELCIINEELDDIIVELFEEVPEEVEEKPAKKSKKK